MVSTIVLAIGTAIELVAVLGLAGMRDTFDRLHYVGLAGYGALFVALAVFIDQPFSLLGNKAILTGVLLVGFGPVVVHATARSFRSSDDEHERLKGTE